MSNFLRKYNLTKLTLENRAILSAFIEKIETCLRINPTKIITINNFTQDFYQTIKECVINMLFKLLQCIGRTCNF